MGLPRDSLTIRELEPGEESIACALAREVFAEAVAPALNQNGVKEFNRHAEADALRSIRKMTGEVLERMGQAAARLRSDRTRKSAA